jgi:large subunit ribosomal protein L17
MRHNVGGRQLAGDSSARKALYRNLVTDLLDHEKITTTEPKAKEIRSLAEKMITLGKDKDLSARRRALAFIFDEKVVDKVFDNYAVKYIDRQGGYTRIIKLGRRQGDGAPMVRLELVD